MSRITNSAGGHAFANRPYPRFESHEDISISDGVAIWAVIRQIIGTNHFFCHIDHLIMELNNKAGLNIQLLLIKY
jgi:hypothetical protein